MVTVVSGIVFACATRSHRRLSNILITRTCAVVWLLQICRQEIITLREVRLRLLFTVLKQCYDACAGDESAKGKG